MPVPNIALSSSANLISLPLLAKSPPNCGVVSSTKSVDTVAKLNTPLPFVFKNCPLEPSSGSVYALVLVKLLGPAKLIS